MTYWVNVYHDVGVSIDDYPIISRYCEECGDSDYAYECETLEEACLFVLKKYGENTLKNCGYEIASIEFREV